MTKQDMLDRNDLEAENEDLRDALDAIADIAAPAEGGGKDEEDHGDGDGR